MYRTTLTDPTGVVHAVNMPDIPADYPDGGTVTPRPLCKIGRGEGMPASMARRTRHPAFVGRTVTCHACNGLAVQEV